MRRTAGTLSLFGLIILVSSLSQVSAGVYTDDVGKCLVKSTTAGERGMLVAKLEQAMGTAPPKAQ